MAQPKKRAVRARKCKCKCHISQSLEMRRRGQQIGNNDTLPKAPAKVYRDAGANIKIKIRRK